VEENENMREKIAIYSRKSKFTGKGESIENQIELCRQYIRVHYSEEALNNILVYEDEGFSGKNMERPQFQRMIQDAKEKLLSSIICYRLDRISRNIGDFAKLIEELNDLDISFVSIKEQFDTSSPMGRAMMYIASVFSQLERETIAERIRDNMHELSKTGRWLGGTTPTGYTSESLEKVTIDGKIKKACKLSLIFDEANVILQVYDKFIETGSLSKTETYLIQNKYTTKNGTFFSRFAIKNILSNPVYMVADNDAYRYLLEMKVDLYADQSEFDGKSGIMAYNRTIQNKGKAHKDKNMEEWVVSVGRHEGIISGDTWIKVQKLLLQNKSKEYRKPRSNVALLSGLLFCGNCGKYMRPKLSRRYNNQGEQIYSYLCSVKEKSRCHCCNIKNANGNLLDRVIWDEIKKISEDGSEFLQLLKRIKNSLASYKEDYLKDTCRINKLLIENEKGINELAASLAKASGSVAEEYIIKQIEELHKSGKALKIRINELEELYTSQDLAGNEFDIKSQLLASFQEIIDLLNVEQKRAAIRTLIKKVVWDGTNVHIYLLGSSGGDKEPQGEDSK